MQTSTAGASAGPQAALSPRGRDEIAAATMCAAVACLFGAQVIHTAVMDEHLASWLWAGLFFFCLAVVEGLLAAGLLWRPSRQVTLATVAVSLATVGLWAISRTAGLPFGPHPWTPEPSGTADAVASVFELVTAGALMSLPRGAPVGIVAPRGTAGVVRRFLVPGAVIGVVAVATFLAVTAPVHGHA